VTGRGEVAAGGDAGPGGAAEPGGATEPGGAAETGGAAFKAFEAAGWSARAGTYDALMARATALAIEPLLDAAGVVSGTRVLDVGCGLGTLAAAAAARGATVTGVDLAAGMLAEARRRHTNVEFVLADAEALPFADQAFDVALGAFIVNHLPDPERAAAELRRVARTVALAMWGPEEEVGILGLPARAARDLDAAIPPGPDANRFTDAGELAALIGGTISEIRATLPIASLDELWDGVRGGTVRTAARLAAASPTQRDAVRTHLAELAEPYRTPTGYELPTTIRIVVTR
jgi:SAM-dependent methyltransferase